MKKYSLLVTALLVAIAFAAGIWSTQSASAEKKAAVAKSAPKALPRLLDLGATTCVPCKMMAKVLDELKKEYNGKLKVDFIDVKKDTAAVEKYKVKLIPLQIFYDAKGKEFYRHEGFLPKADIVAKFMEHKIDLSK